MPLNVLSSSTPIPFMIKNEITYMDPCKYDVFGLLRNWFIVNKKKRLLNDDFTLPRKIPTFVYNRCYC